VKRDPVGKIRFASLQSKTGIRMLGKYKIDENYIDSLILFEEERYSVSSTAALRTLSFMAGWERHLQLLSIVPRPFRDLIYSIISKNRYKWFGRREHCMIPTAELIERFLAD